MTEDQIRQLGFQIQHDDGGGYWDPYYYFTYEIDGLEFVSNASDETPEDAWYVEFFDTMTPLRFYEYEELKQLIAILEKAKLKTQEHEQIK
jgi:hypothetical protein